MRAEIQSPPDSDWNGPITLPAAKDRLSRWVSECGGAPPQQGPRTLLRAPP
jgi:hypothetical protein